MMITVQYRQVLQQNSLGRLHGNAGGSTGRRNKKARWASRAKYGLENKRALAVFFTRPQADLKSALMKR
jgi:hypothetical protein